MTRTRIWPLRPLAAGGAALLAGSLPALAQAPSAAAQVEAITNRIDVVQAINPGNTAWMLTATALVLLMTVPGLALFYGGLVRSKNMLSTLTQVFAIVCLACLVWVCFTYSLAFTGGGGLNAFIGGFSKLFLVGITPDSPAATFSPGSYIPEYVYVAFQMTFAAITPALIVGAFAERMRFSALVAFTLLWTVFVYAPIAHMVWYWAGPDAVARAQLVATALAGNPALSAAATAALDAVNNDSGYLYRLGALDFAGGTVVHINAGVAGLVGALVLGKRVGYGKDLMAPHSLTLAMVGASLLWVGWFGFNAGSNLEATGGAALAMINTFVATAAAALSWLFVEWAVKGKPSLLGLISGAVAGLVAVTPASGFAGPMGSIVLGLVAGAACFLACTSIKNALRYDDSLDAFGVHAVGGIIGAIGTGILVLKSTGGVGYVDYKTCTAALAAGGAVPDLTTLTENVRVAFSNCQSTEDGLAAHLKNQLIAVAVTLAWTTVGSFILYKLVDLVIGLRVPVDVEREGLDVAEHGERAYNA